MRLQLKENYTKYKRDLAALQKENSELKAELKERARKTAEYGQARPVGAMVRPDRC